MDVYGTQEDNQKVPISDTGPRKLTQWNLRHLLVTGWIGIGSYVETHINPVEVVTVG